MLYIPEKINHLILKETANRVVRQVTTYVERIYGKEATIKSTSNYNIEFVMKNNEKGEYEFERIMAIINTIYQSFLVVASTNR